MEHNKITGGRFLFWQGWLYYSSILFALFGVVFAVYGNNPLFRPYNTMLAKIFWGAREMPGDAENFRAFIFAPLGGTIACCYILLAFIARYPFKEKQVWARNAVTLAFAVWIIIDSIACLYYKVYPQAYLVNAFSFLVKALPLIFSWNDFKYPTRGEH